MVNDAEVKMVDIPVTNGVVHVISKVRNNFSLDTCCEKITLFGVEK